MHTGLKVALGLTLGGAIIIATAPFWLSADQVWPQISAQIEQQTGRTFTVDGDKRLSLFPQLALELHQARLSNVAGGIQRDLLTVDQLEVVLPWRFLWTGELELEQFSLEKPVIHLETNAKGEPNWLLQATHASSTKPATSASPTKPAAFDLHVGDVRIKDGRVDYHDGKTGQQWQVSAVNLDVELPSLRQQAILRGDLTYQQQPLQFELQLDSLALLLEQQPVKFAIDAHNDLVTLAMAGDYKVKSKQVQAQLEVKGPSLAKLQQWLQALSAGETAREIPPGTREHFLLQAAIQATPAQVHFSQFKAQLDALAAAGQAQLFFEATPRLVGQISTEALDFTPYAPAPSTNRQVSETKGWDTTPMDFSGLRTLNADIQLQSPAWQFRDIVLGETKWQFQLNQGVARVHLLKFNGYQGTGSGYLQLDSRQKPYRLQTEFNLQGIAAEPLLTDSIGLDKLLGTGALNLKLSSQGMSQQQWLEQLQGPVQIELKDGAIRGANIAAIIRSAQQALTGNLQGINLDKDFKSSEATDFSSLTASWQFQQGIGQSSDLQLQSPLLRLTAEGQIDLPKQSLSYVLTPRLIASLEGQGGSNDGKSVVIPVKVQGPWQAVKIRPDLTSGAKQKAKDKLKETLDSKLKGLLGG